QYVVGLLQRHARFDDEAPHAGATVITEMAMELLDPRIGREHQGDLGLAHRGVSPVDSPPTGSNGVASRNGGAPVARTKVIVPVSSADAMRAAAAESTPTVTLASSDPCNGPASPLENATTCTLVAT